MRSGTSEISKLQLSLEAPYPYYIEILFQKIPTEIFKQKFSVSNRKILQKQKISVRNRKFLLETENFCQNRKFLFKTENFCQNRKFLSKQKISVKTEK